MIQAFMSTSPSNRNPLGRFLLPALALGLMVVATPANAQQFGYWNSNSGGAWETNNRWFQNVRPANPGDIGIVLRNISGDQTITLEADRTMGYFNIGDTNRTHSWTIAPGTGGGSMIFDQGTGGGHAYLTKFAGLADDISANIILNDNLVVISRENVEARSLTLSGTLSGSGSLIVGAYSEGQLFITGNNSASTVGIEIYQRGTGNIAVVPQVTFNSAVGNAVGGGLRLGNATISGNGNAVLNLGEGRSNLDQIKDSIHVIADGFNSNNRRAFFRLMGGSETIGGISDLGNGLVIENWNTGSSQSSAATLTINGATNSRIAGIMRNTAVTTAGNSIDDNVNNGAGADEHNQGDTKSGTTYTPSPYALSLVKAGSSTLTLAGNRIYYTGGTTVSGGTLVLDGTTNFRSDIVNNSALVMNQNSGTWNFRREFADPGGGAPTPENLKITGTGSLTKTGNGILVINSSNNSFGAGLRVNAGTLTLGGNNNVISSITMDGDHGINRDLNINGSATVAGNMNLRGNTGEAGSNVNISGAITTSGIVNIRQTAFQLSGGGSLSNPSAINMAGAPIATNATNVGTEFKIDNTSGSNNTNRVGDSTVFNSMGGDFTFSNDGTNTAFSEIIGALNLQSGSLNMTTSRAGASGSSNLTFASLNRPGTGTINFDGPSVGVDGRNRVIFTSTPALNDGIIGNWATVGPELATYGGNGVTAYTTYSSAAAGAWNDDTLNVKVTSAGTQNIGNNQLTRTVNTLNLQATGTININGSGSILTVDGGLILASGSTTNFNVSTLRPGAGGGHQLIFNVEDVLGRLVNVDSVITDNGSAATVIKTGVGRLALNSVNSYTGPTIINEGSIRITSDRSLGAVPASVSANNIQLNGGNLHLNLNSGTTTLSSNRGLSVSEAGGRIEVGNSAGDTATLEIFGPINAAGVIDLAPNGDPSISTTSILNLGHAGSTNTFTGGLFTVGPFQGTTNVLGNNTIGHIEVETGALNITGNNTLTGNVRVLAGNLSINGNNTFSGSVSVSDGSLSLLSANALGSAPLDISLGSGNLILNGVSRTLSGISGGDFANITNRNATASVVTFDLDQNQSFGGTIQNGIGGGSLGLIKTGNGMLTLSNRDSSFSGNVRIQGGTLSVTSIGNALVSSALGTALDTAASRLVIDQGVLRFNQNTAISSNRSFTMGAGANGATLLAEGVGRESAITLGLLTVNSPSANSPAVAFEGAGERTLTLASRNDGYNAFNLVLGDAGAGQPTSVRKTGVGQWALTRTNTYTGLTTVEDGELAVAKNGALGAGVSGGGLGTELVGGRMIFSDVNYTTDEDIFFLGGRMDVVGGTSTFGGRLVFNRPGTVYVNEGATLQHTGSISGNQSLTFDAPGTLILSGTHITASTDINRFVGTVAVREGTLILDYGTNDASKMGGQLQLGGGRRGGTVILRGGTHAENVTNLFINSGTSRVIREAGSNATINFNNINNNSSGNVIIGGPGFATTNKRNTNGILASSIMIEDGAGGISWGVNSDNANDGPIVPFSAFSVDTWGANLNIDARNSTTQTAGSMANTLRFNQPATPGFLTVTLAGGVNEINTGGILVTANMGTDHAVIAGPGSLSSGGDSFSGHLTISQYNLAADLAIFAPITDGSGNDGIEKLGEGRVAIMGAHDFTGSVTISEGGLSIDTLANAGVASGLGAGGAGSGNILFNGGRLTYLGETASTDRAFNVAGPFAEFRIGHDRTAVTFGGNNAGGERIIKEGAGTFILTDRSLGILAWDINEGAVQLNLNAGNNRFASSISELTLGGGTLHIVGDTAANRSQQFGGQMYVNAGASTVKVTPIYDTVNSANRNATLHLQGAEEDFPIIRNSGGSVHFIEDSLNAGNSIADIRLNIPFEDRQRVIPWATYKDTALVTRPGVNEFATVEGNISGVTDSSGLQLHTIGTTTNDPNNWTSTLDVSEAIVGTTTFGLGGTGTLTADRSVRTIKYFTPEDSVISVPTGQKLTLSQGAILLSYNVRQGNKSIVGDGTITGSLRSEDGGQDLLIHNYNQSSPFTIGTSIIDSSAMIVPAGVPFLPSGGYVIAGSPSLEIGINSQSQIATSVRVGDNVTGPGIAEGTTVVAIDSNTGIITLSLSATSTESKQTYTFTSETNFVQAGIGTTILAGNNQYGGETFVTGGVLRLNSANAIPGGLGATGGLSALIIDGGVVGLGNGNFARDLNTSAAGVQFTGSGGFAAYGADRTVNFGGLGSPKTVDFGRTTFVPSGSSFVLGAHDSTHKVSVLNPIRIGFQSQMIRVNDGVGAVDGELAGALFGEGTLIKGGLGQLRFAVSNEHTGGTNVAEGSLRAANAANVLGTGSVLLGTSTTHTLPGSALTLIMEGGTHANAVSVGSANSEGNSLIRFESNTTLSGPVGLESRAFVAPNSGVTASLSGAITGTQGMVVTGGGTVTLSNAGNNFGTAAGSSGAAVNGGTTIRSGSVVVTNGAALGSTTVELGDAVPSVIAVDRVGTPQSVAKLMGEFDPTHNGDFTGEGGPGGFVEVSDTIDGHTYTEVDAGKLILVQNEGGNPEQNGIYRVHFDSGGQIPGTINLVRAAEFDTAGEALYGTRIDVATGSAAGSSFFLANGVGTMNQSAINFRPDQANANISLLAGSAGLTIGNSVDVNATNGTGLTTIGADSTVTSGSVTFSGSITLQDLQAGTRETKTLRVASSTSADLGVIMSGLISEADSGMAASDDVLSLFKTGTGVATLTNANTFTGGVTVDTGTLLVNNTAGSATGTGAVLVNNGATLGGTGTIGGATTVLGALRPGSPILNDGVGTINIDGNLTLGATSQTFFTLAGASAGIGVNDRLVVGPAGQLFVDPTAMFVVELGSGFTPSQGDKFDLVDWTTLAAGGDVNWADQITLPMGIAWNTSLLNTMGIISVVPEPSRVVLLAGGFLALALRRRRRHI